MATTVQNDPKDWSPAEDAISAAAKKCIMSHDPILIPSVPGEKVPFLIRFAERPPEPMAGNRTYAGCTGSKAEDYMDDDQ